MRVQPVRQRAVPRPQMHAREKQRAERLFEVRKAGHELLWVLRHGLDEARACGLPIVPHHKRFRRVLGHAARTSADARKPHGRRPGPTAAGVGNAQGRRKGDGATSRSYRSAWHTISPVRLLVGKRLVSMSTTRMRDVTNTTPPLAYTVTL